LFCGWVRNIEIMIRVLYAVCRTSRCKQVKEMHSADIGSSSSLAHIDQKERCIKILPGFLVVQVVRVKDSPPPHVDEGTPMLTSHPPPSEEG
jgi:hypothetical protein